MTWIPMSLEFMRNLYFLRALGSSCLANFGHFSSSSNSPSFRSLSSIFSSSISLINSSSFWMASSASSLLLAFFLHFLHHIIYNSPLVVSVFRSHTDIFMHHYFYFMTPWFCCIFEMCVCVCAWLAIFDLVLMLWCWYLIIWVICVVVWWWFWYVVIYDLMIMV